MAGGRGVANSIKSKEGTAALACPQAGRSCLLLPTPAPTPGTATASASRQGRRRVEDGGGRRSPSRRGARLLLSMDLELVVHPVLARVGCERALQMYSVSNIRRLGDSMPAGGLISCLGQIRLGLSSVPDKIRQPHHVTHVTGRARQTAPAAIINMIHFRAIDGCGGSRMHVGMPQSSLLNACCVSSFDVSKLGLEMGPSIHPGPMKGQVA